VTGNPEFDRNLWLELSPHRLIALPVVFGLLLLLNLALNDNQLLKPSAYAAIALFLFYTGIWGTKLAAGSVFEEVVGRTWEWQRMSGLDPWSMTWGKLFGSTIYAWYGGVLCLLVAVIGLVNAGAGMRDWQWLLLAVLVVLFSHALGLLLNLLYIRSRPLERARSGGSLYLLVLLLIAVMSWTLGPASEERIFWYGAPVSLLEFVFASVLFGWIWSVIGAYRVMRREFLYAAKPWVWAAFLAFLAVYFGGLTAKSPMEWFLSAYFFWWAATLLALFVEQKDPVVLRGLFDAWRGRDFNKAILLMPSWLTSLLFVLFAVFVLLLMSGEVWEWKPGKSLGVGVLIFTLVMFLIRDVAIFLLLGFSGQSKRPEVTAVVYLLVLYLVIPWLLNTLVVEILTVFFLPRPDLSLFLAMGGSFAGAAMVLILLFLQWRRVSGPAST